MAPISMAVSRLNSTGSMAITRLAPEIAAPCTALMPTPPMPTTATLSPAVHPGPVDRGADAGGHAAADQGHDVEGQVGLHLHQ